MQAGASHHARRGKDAEAFLMLQIIQTKAL
jgi:hypothetical protein